MVHIPDLSPEVCEIDLPDLTAGMYTRGPRDLFRQNDQNCVIKCGKVWNSVTDS